MVYFKEGNRWDERIFMLYLHIHKTTFRLKYFFIHNISAQLCLLWTSLELHFPHLFQTQRIRCCLHFKQKSEWNYSSAFPERPGLASRSEGTRWASPRTEHFISDLSMQKVTVQYQTIILLKSEAMMKFVSLIKKINFSTLTRWSTKKDCICQSSSVVSSTQLS